MASETRNLTSATSSQFIMCSALKEEDGLFGLMRKLMRHQVTLCLLFSSEWVRWVGWSQPQCARIHTASSCTAGSPSRGASGQVEGVYKVVSWSCKSKRCFRSGRPTERQGRVVGWVFGISPCLGLRLVGGGADSGSFQTVSREPNLMPPGWRWK